MVLSPGDTLKRQGVRARKWRTTATAALTSCLSILKMVSLKAALRNTVLITPARRWLVTEPRFVIVGTGRSGTRYISRLLRAVGIKCGHENWWSLKEEPTTRLHGDASWVATFRLTEYSGQIFHQIRDPLLVVNSLVRGRDELAPGSITHALRSQWVEITGDRVRDALEIVSTWVSEAERVAHWSWRLEDVDAKLLVEISNRVGKPVRLERAERAIDTVSTSTNLHTQPDAPAIQWDDIPESEHKARVLEIARRYNYL
jgi:hypothetical protein